MDIATCMYYTGLDPFTMKPVESAKNLRDRRIQRALMQFIKPENWFEVRDALMQANRPDLIGGCDGLIPAQPPKEAFESGKKRATDADHYHTVANPSKDEQPGERGAGPARRATGRGGRRSSGGKMMLLYASPGGATRDGTTISLTSR